MAYPFCLCDNAQIRQTKDFLPYLNEQYAKQYPTVTMVRLLLKLSILQNAGDDFVRDSLAVLQEQNKKKRRNKRTTQNVPKTTVTKKTQRKRNKSKSRVYANDEREGAVEGVGQSVSKHKTM